MLTLTPALSITSTTDVRPSWIALNKGVSMSTKHKGVIWFRPRACVKKQSVSISALTGDVESRVAVQLAVVSLIDIPLRLPSVLRMYQISHSVE